MLNNPFGLSACGLEFIYTNKKHRANIKIFIQNNNFVFSQKTISITRYFFFFPKTAIIKVLEPASFKNSSDFFTTINHEIGHALFHLSNMKAFINQHSKKPESLMYKYIVEKQDSMPSKVLIDIVKQHLAHQKTAPTAVFNFSKNPLYNL